MMKGEGTVSIKEYFDNKVVELQKYMDLKFDSIEKSTCLAQENLNLRLDSMNEFRNTMKDQAARFITREELSLMLDTMSKDIRHLLDAQAKQEGMATQKSVTIAYIISSTAIIIGVLQLFIR